MDALRAIGDDVERRKEAKKNLKSALTSYLDDLPRAPEGLPNSILMLAEIWGRYAVILYDSLAERHFSDSSAQTETLFGESGDLYGGTTIAQVKDALTTLRIRTVREWPIPNFSQDVDSQEMRSTMNELARAVTASPYSFSWLLHDESFMAEIWKRVRGRADHWRRKFEQKFGSNRDSIQTPRRSSGESPPTIADTRRRSRREILKRYRQTKGIGTQQGLAWHFGVSLTALQGMVRGDRSRYSVETLGEVLKKMNVLPDEW